jgi:hypothetical protein
MTLKIRAVNHTITDEDGNKIYLSHTFQTQQDGGAWVNIPVIEIHLEPGDPRLVIVDQPPTALSDGRNSREALRKAIYDTPPDDTPFVSEVLRDKGE